MGNTEKETTGKTEKETTGNTDWRLAREQFDGRLCFCIRRADTCEGPKPDSLQTVRLSPNAHSLFRRLVGTVSHSLFSLE